MDKITTWLVLFDISVHIRLDNQHEVISPHDCGATQKMSMDIERVICNNIFFQASSEFISNESAYILWKDKAFRRSISMDS